MIDTRVHTAVVMDTSVSIRVVGDVDEAAIAHAFELFTQIEHACSRFDTKSELHSLTRRIGQPVPVSDILFETIRFALALARDTGGAFDPTIGKRMEERGFDREYRSGKTIATPIGDLAATYRDVELDVANRAITLHRPLLLDLGAVAKGFAVDMAARELAESKDFAIDAGGDLYLGGVNERGEEWTAGIRHPRNDGETIDSVQVSNAAVCTSGDYVRRTHSGHHILDPLTGSASATLASATVIAPLAMVADGLATAAFVLGPIAGRELLERHGVQGLLITPDLERIRIS